MLYAIIDLSFESASVIYFNLKVKIIWLLEAYEGLNNELVCRNGSGKAGVVSLVNAPLLPPVAIY